MDKTLNRRRCEQPEKN